MMTAPLEFLLMMAAVTKMVAVVAAAAAAAALQQRYLGRNKTSLASGSVAIEIGSGRWACLC